MRTAGWIRVLVVVLATTASRRNFPVLGAAGNSCSDRSSALTQVSTARREGVVPSRRHQETRRADWVKKLASVHAASLLERPVIRTSAPLREYADPSSLRQPRYLSAFQKTLAQESIPPPVRCGPGAGLASLEPDFSERT